ncbi:unnamed protein product [Timema podura]|uniref:Uncharacterized protein n=1 Tax=Timema podura TaxID=61482 RepID=A0ABN7NVR6_TIMPD|nr:unnamed protein product [Timema podura]
MSKRREIGRVLVVEGGRRESVRGEREQGILEWGCGELVWQQKLSQEWESLPDEKKAQYLDKASHHWQLYRQELQLWEEKMIRLGHIDVVRNEALIEPRSNK